ncbi:MAG: diaminopimelate epimerase [Planctomycetota bacterium]
MKFTKMHGIGNDYVYVNCFEETIADPAKLAVAVSDRHFGIGGDGLIMVCPSDVADCKMRILNADGSEAEMCGNGIRCVAKFAYERGISKKNPMKVETLAGVKTIDLIVKNNRVEKATVDMGAPRLNRADIPMTGPQGRVVDEPLVVDGATYRITCVNVGNPHCMIFVDDVDAVHLEQVGPKIENHKVFPKRINVHFVQVLGKAEIKMRTWERGSGITLACGTGATATCVACALNEKTGRKILAHLPGGDLELNWSDNDRIYMTGPATEVFQGEWPE